MWNRMCSLEAILEINLESILKGSTEGNKERHTHRNHLPNDVRCKRIDSDVLSWYNCLWIITACVHIIPFNLGPRIEAA